MKIRPTPPPHHTTHTIKILRIFLSVGHPRDPKGENHGYLTTFRSINEPKSGPCKYKNKAQTLPKQVQNNFEKVQKTTFLTPKMVKNDPSKLPKWAKFWPKISIIGVIYRPLELKIHPKVGLLRSKTMPKHFLNNSKTTLKTSRKWLFWPLKSKCKVKFWPSEGGILTNFWVKKPVFWTFLKLLYSCSASV